MKESCLSVTEDPPQLHHRYCAEFNKDRFLAPILILLYTAELLRLIDGMELRSHFFADDTQIYGSCDPDAAPALQQRISTCVVRKSGCEQTAYC